MKVLAYLVGLALAPFVVCFLGAWLLALIARKYGTDPHAKPSGVRVCFEGHDEDLRKRTEKRRADADAIRRDASRLETRDREERVLRIQRGGGR